MRDTMSSQDNPIVIDALRKIFKRCTPRIVSWEIYWAEVLWDIAQSLLPGNRMPEGRRSIKIVMGSALDEKLKILRNKYPMMSNEGLQEVLRRFPEASKYLYGMRKDPRSPARWVIIKPPDDASPRWCASQKIHERLIRRIFNQMREENKE